MSVRPVENVFLPSAATILKKEAEQGGRSFQDAFATAAARGTGAAAERPVAREAEFLRLTMMRSALSLDGAAVSPPLTAGRMEKLAAALAGDAGQTGSVVPQGTDSPQPATAAPTGQQAPSSGAPASHPSVDAVVSRASRRYGVDESLIKAVIKAESNFKTTAVSSAGAQGLMQLMPATAAGLGVSDSFNPEQNVMAGTRFLKDLLNRYGGDLDKALAAYNWGPGNLDRGKGRLPLETREYLVKVKKYYADYSSA